MFILFVELLSDFISAFNFDVYLRHGWFEGQGQTMEVKNKTRNDIFK